MEERLKKISIVAEYLSGGISYREFAGQAWGQFGIAAPLTKQYQIWQKIRYIARKRGFDNRQGSWENRCPQM